MLQDGRDEYSDVDIHELEPKKTLYHTQIDFRVRLEPLVEARDRLEY